MSLKPVDMLKQAVLSEDDYKKQCPLLADLIRSSKLPVCKDVVSQIKKIIKSKSNPPPQKLRALKALNTLMLVGNVNLLIFTGKKIMSRLSILASHKKEYPIEVRAESIFGKDSFSNQENRNSSIEFINHLLDFIRNWASEFGKAPDKSESIFFLTYNKLKESGVKFPIKQPTRSKEERKASIPKRPSTIDQVAEVISLLEESTDRAMIEEYKQILRSSKLELENALQVAMTNENSSEIETLLEVIDKITAALESNPRYPRLSNPKPASSSAFMTGSPGLRTGISEKNTGFDLFDLEISPAQNTKASAFVTHQPIITNYDGKGQKSNLFPTSSLFPPSGKGSLFPSPEKSENEERVKISSFAQEDNRFASGNEFSENPKAQSRSLFPENSKPEGRSSLFPEEKKVFDSSNSNLFPIQSKPDNSLFPKQAKSDNNLFQSSPDPDASLFSDPSPKYQFNSNSSKEDPQISKLKLENSQLLEALELSKKLLSDRDSHIYSLSKEIEKLKKSNEDLDTELKESLEVIDYLQQKLEKKKLAEKQSKEQQVHQSININANPVQSVAQTVYVPQVQPTQSKPSQISLFPEEVNIEKTRPERKDQDDFDLDFILGSSTKKKEPEPVSMFEIPTSPSKPAQAAPLVAENTLLYRMGNCMEMGVLFDSDIAQVGFQVKRQATDLFCMIFIGNKGNSPFVEVQTELQDIHMECFPMMMQPIKTNDEIQQNAQTTRMIKAQFSTYTAKVPKLSIRILINSGEVLKLLLKLPLTIARFIEARQELPSSIWIEWKKLVFEEDASVVALAPFNSFPEMCSFLCFTIGFALYSNNEIPDLGPVEVLAAGQFEDTLVMFLIGLTGNGSNAKFNIRCRNNVLRDALAPIIKAQISK